VNPSYYIEKKAWDQAVNAARSFDEGFTLAEYRDRLGTTRKYAVEFLPAMDKVGITIFDGEKRRTVK
jgi:selenocysteine-specific elongation factor